MDMSAHPAPVPVRRRDPGHTVVAATTAFVATVVGLIFLAWLVLFITKGRFLKHPFERILSSYSQRTVTVAGDFNLYFDPIAIRFKAEGISVSNPTWASKPNLFQASLVDARIETFHLILGEKILDWLTLRDGAIDAEWDAKHEHNTWTFGQPTTKGQPFRMPLIRKASVTGTTVRFRDPMMFLSTDIGFQDINGVNNTVANNIRFSGDGTIRKEPFTVFGQQTSPNQLIAGGGNQFELHVHSPRTFIDVAGTLPAATQIEGADLSVAARGRNMRDLFDLIGVAVPDTRTYRLRAHMMKSGDEYRFTRLTGMYGNSDLAGWVTVALPPPARGGSARPNITADLSSRFVDIVDIGPFIGYNPTALATQGATAAATTQHKGDGVPRILPDAPLRADAIKGFDAKVTYRIKDIKQPYTPISNILLGLNLDHSLLKLSPLNFDVAGGHLDSDISIDARRPAVFTDYDIRLSPTPMGTLLKRFGVDQAGTTGTIKARIKMTGTGDTVRQSLATSNGRIAIILPKGTFWTKYVQLAEFDLGVFVQRLFQKQLKKPVEINCGLIGFTVRDGIAAADPILIDTTGNVMTAKGGFSFKDESLSFAFRADAKKFSLFSGQSPVGINGHFAAPGISIISPQLLTRAGAAVVLGVVGTPIASLLAFVDPGDAKSAACGPVLAGANAAAQRTSKGDPRKDIGKGKTADVKAEQGKKKILGL